MKRSDPYKDLKLASKSQLVSDKLYLKSAQLTSIELLTLLSSFKVCWSQKGKQLICGTQSGDLVQCTPDGSEKATYLTPPEISEPHCGICFINFL